MISVSFDRVGTIELEKPLPIDKNWDCSLLSCSGKRSDEYLNEEEKTDKKERIIAISCNFITNHVNTVGLSVLALVAFDGRKLSAKKKHLIKHHLAFSPIQRFTIRLYDNKTSEDLTNRFDQVSIELLFTKNYDHSIRR